MDLPIPTITLRPGRLPHEARPGTRIKMIRVGAHPQSDPALVHLERYDRRGHLAWVHE